MPIEQDAEMQHYLEGFRRAGLGHAVINLACPLFPRMCCKTRVLFTARPDLSIAEPVVFSTVPSGGAID
jgi:hypothetical protein